MLSNTVSKWPSYRDTSVDVPPRDMRQTVNKIILPISNPRSGLLLKTENAVLEKPTTPAAGPDRIELYPEKELASDNPPSERINSTETLLIVLSNPFKKL